VGKTAVSRVESKHGNQASVPSATGPGDRRARGAIASGGLYAGGPGCPANAGARSEAGRPGRCRCDHRSGGGCSGGGREANRRPQTSGSRAASTGGPKPNWIWGSSEFPVRMNPQYTTGRPTTMMYDNFYDNLTRRDPDLS